MNATFIIYGSILFNHAIRFKWWIIVQLQLILVGPTPQLTIDVWIFLYLILHCLGLLIIYMIDSLYILLITMNLNGLLKSMKLLILIQYIVFYCKLDDECLTVFIWENCQFNLYLFAKRIPWFFTFCFITNIVPNTFDELFHWDEINKRKC